MQNGKMKRGKAPSPSSSMAVKAELASAPHSDLIPPPDAFAVETARRAEVANEAHALLHDGLLSHEIVERYPDDAHWMADKVGDWEVHHRREQLHFVENMDKPSPTFNTAKPKPEIERRSMAALPRIAIDKRHLKAVSIKAEITCAKTGEITDEMVWFPRFRVSRD